MPVRALLLAELLLRSAAQTLPGTPRSSAFFAAPPVLSRQPSGILVAQSAPSAVPLEWDMRAVHSAQHARHQASSSAFWFLSGAAVAVGAAAYSGAKSRESPRVRRRVSAPPTMKWAVDIAPWKVEYGLQSAPVSLPDGVKEGDAPQPWTITDEQRELYKRDGVIHIPGLLNEEWLEYLRGATDWQVQNPHFWSSAGVASGMYDYIQRSVWASNDAFANFMYYSPLASALAGVADAKELRLATDLLMVNPNSGFKWHQDNQNGPIDAFNENTALRWWVTMDDSPAEYGYPVYLKGSHKNTTITDEAVFVDLEKDGLLEYPEMLEFKPKAGDLLIWHSRSIHKIDGAPSRDWGQRRRRVLGGTVAVDDAKYLTKGRALFSDMGSHGLVEGGPLAHAYFPKIYPQSDPQERAERAAGNCTRTTEGMMRMAGNMFASVGEMVSWTKVLNGKDEDTKAPQKASAPAEELEGKVRPGIPAWVMQERSGEDDAVDSGERASLGTQ